VAAAIRAKQSISLDWVWTAPGAMPDARALALSSLGAYVIGRANSTGASFPASVKTESSYPAPNATSGSVLVPAPNVVVTVPTLGDIGITYTNRNGNFVRSRYTYQ
jgi:hypothetical protein